VIRGLREGETWGSQGRPWPGQGGISLVELLAAALVFGVVGLAMGTYYVFSVQRVEAGSARAELQRNGSLALQVVGEAIRGGRRVIIPAEGEPPGGQSSATVRFPPEPFTDENLNGQFDAAGATGPCAPAECLEDVNGNGIWDAEWRPARSFRLAGGVLEVRDEGGGWQPLLDNRYPDSGSSSVWADVFTLVPDPQDPDAFQIRLLIRDDHRTPGDAGDDLRQALELRVRRKG
jgi:type II secretory pathway pseudopilin PulG